VKNIILVNGNPKKNSFSSCITDKYAQAARKSANIRIFNLPEMDFDPNLMCGYDDDQPLAPCLKEFSKSLHWANHIVIISPLWWGGLLAKLKGETARMILTMDTPAELAAEYAQSYYLTMPKQHRLN